MDRTDVETLVRQIRKSAAIYNSQYAFEPSGAAVQCHFCERVVASHLTSVALRCTSETATVSQATPMARKVAFCRSLMLSCVLLASVAGAAALTVWQTAKRTRQPPAKEDFNRTTAASGKVNMAIFSGVCGTRIGGRRVTVGFIRGRYRAAAD